MNQDTRWNQRFSNYKRALKKLTQAIDYVRQNESRDSQIVLDEIIKEGLIQRFEYTHELAWNVMKDYATYQGNSTVGGSRDATREAFQLKLISDGSVWMDMIGSRNKTSHTYNEATADEIYFKILNHYFASFQDFQEVMQIKEEVDESFK